MNHEDHVRLIERAVTKRDKIWADLGSGTGAFTRALQSLIDPDGKIYSVDSDDTALQAQKTTFKNQFPDATIQYIHKDFREKLYLPRLDGMIMANSLHFVQNQEETMIHLLRYLKPGGKFVLVEYNADEGNQWVPYPLSHKSFNRTASVVGLSKPKLIGTVPSQFLKEMYCCMAIKTDSQ